MEIDILDKDLNLVMLIDSYTSVIWDVYYNKVGAGELYIAATTEVLQNIRQGYYVERSDSDRLMRIRKIELDTSAENGNYLIFSLETVEGILAQRIVWGTSTCNGKLEPWLHSLVAESTGGTAGADRIIRTPGGVQLIQTGSLQGFKETGGDQTSYGNVADKLTNICKREGWGFRLVPDGGHFKFEIYKGADRSNEVFFSDEFGNLITTQYIDDCTKLGNVSLVAGEGEGSDRVKIPCGEATGADRFEVYIDARDLSHSITYGELTKAYPGGYVRTVNIGTQEEPEYKYYYHLDTLNIALLSAAQEAILTEEYTHGMVVTIDGARYYEIINIDVAEVTDAAPEDDTTAEVINALYYSYLTDRGITKLAEYGEKVSFSGEIEPNGNFVYGVDYELGDIVTIESGYGITAKARIVEVEEVFDATGHTVTPKYEYIDE